MMQVNMLEAKTELSKLVKQLETNEQDVIYIARGGTPVVQMSLIDLPPATQRIGAGRGIIAIPNEFDDWDAEVEAMFEGAL